MDEHRKAARPWTAGLVLGIGSTLLFSSIAGLLAGHYVDRHTGRTLFAPLGLILGLAAGFHRMWLIIRTVSGVDDSRKRSGS